MSVYPQTENYNQPVSGNAYAQQNFAGHAQYLPNDPRYDSQTASQYCAPGVEPASYYPYASQASAASYDAAYPNEEDMSSKYPRGCANAGADQGYQLNIDSLMPASWKGARNCGDNTADNTQWARYAPSKQSFDRYIQAAGSSRLSMNTRSPLGRQTGIPLLLRQGPPVPISAQEFPFLDSGFRQDLVYRQLGRYPNSTSC